MTAPKTPLPVLDPTTMRVTGEVDVDARLAVPVPVEQPDAHAQRLPVPNDHPAIVDLVLARPLSPAARSVIETRDAIGRARYGTRLQAFNGRDVARDLTEEAADAVIYAMQGLEEARREVTRAKWERRFATAVALLEECVGPASGASILARAAAHNVIAGDELPGVLTALDVARNGPEEQRGDALTPGSTWTGPDGVIYDVVRGEEVGDRPRWWVPTGFHADQVGLEHPGELHTGIASCGTSGLFALVLSHACTAAGCAARTEAEAAACMRPDCDADGGLTVGDVDVFSLETARALLARTDTESADPDDQAELWAGLSAACAEVERLRAEIEFERACALANADELRQANAALDAGMRRIGLAEAEVERWRGLARKWREEIDATHEAIDLLPEYLTSTSTLDRIANAGAVIAQERAETDRLRTRIREFEDHAEKANDERQALDELYDETLAKRDALADEAEQLRVRVSGLEVDLAAAERRGDAHAEEAERLERESARWVASYDAIGDAIEVHLPENAGDLVARIANAGAVIAGARASRDAYQQEARTAERRLTDERSARIEVVQRLERTEATLKRWQTRARKAEARVAVLTEERDGLTLRLGEKERKRVQRSKAKAGARKGGRR